MSIHVDKIRINFPVTVEIYDQEQQDLDIIANHICKRYTREHPGRVMWPAGVGHPMTLSPFMVDKDHPIDFDETTFEIDCAEREDYSWLCKNCGRKQEDHFPDYNYIVSPNCPQGYLPVPKKPLKYKRIRTKWFWDRFLLGAYWDRLDFFMALGFLTIKIRR